MVVATAVTTGCVSMMLDVATGEYYTEGPEAALATLDHMDTDPADRLVVDLERSIPLTELGRYAEAVAALDDARTLLDATVLDPSSPRVTAPNGAYFGEYHERVLLDTVAAVDQLALQQPEKAAAAARRALERARLAPCDACEWGFTRWVLAVALEAAGDRGGAIDVLAEAVAEAGPVAASVLKVDLDRLTGLDGSDAEAFAPPPPGGPERELVVIALLGPGPVKVPDRELGPEGHMVGWPAYLDAGPGVVESVVAEAGRVYVRAVEVADVGVLARRALQARFQRWRALAATDPATPRNASLRAWSTLPASVVVLRISVPTALATVTLSFRGQDGKEVGIEPIPVPREWRSGPLFVVRRLP